MHTEFLSNISPSVLKNVKTLNLDIKSEACNHEVNELLKKTVLLGGKRLRPMLTYLFGELFNLSPKDLNVYARAIECVHAASLSHDDVVDNASLRRGKPSINSLSSNKHAVLAGDYLLADVIVELSKAGHLELVKEMSLIIKDLAEGEWIQLDSAKNRHYSRQIIKDIALKKTSSVMTWCSVVGPYLAGKSDQVVELCRSFGNHLGLAFQLIDDTLDFSENSLKDQLLDLENNTVNSVVYVWLELNQDKKSLYEKGEDLCDLISSPAQDKSLTQAVEIISAQAHSHLDSCREILKKLEELEENHSKKAKASLEFILSYLAKRKS